MKIRKNDQVKIMTGKDKGKTGKVVSVLPKENKLVVEGINMYKKHVRGTPQQEGRIAEIIKPITASNVSLVCPNCNKLTRVGFKVENGKKVRVCKKCNKEILEGVK